MILAPIRRAEEADRFMRANLPARIAAETARQLAERREGGVGGPVHGQLNHTAEVHNHAA